MSSQRTLELGLGGPSQFQERGVEPVSQVASAGGGLFEISIRQPGVLSDS